MRSATCGQGCGLPVKWVRDGKRWVCQNQDGSDHCDLCSKTRTRKVIAHGRPFKDQRGEGFIYRGKRKYMHQHDPDVHVAVGERYKTSCGCDIPPWEECDCSARLAA